MLSSFISESLHSLAAIRYKQRLYNSDSARQKGGLHFDYPLLSLTFHPGIDASERGLLSKYDATVCDFHGKLGAYFRWTMGIVLAGWLSIMGAILFEGSL